MPVFFLRRLTGDKRSRMANRQLGLSLAFVAGAMNAGGFLAVGQYTSHMTGMVSSIADHLAVNQLPLVLAGLGSVACFTAGAAYSAILINWGRHHRMHSQYAYPLLWEAGLLLAFGLMGGWLEVQKTAFLPVTVMLLCFLMGLQNAIITKISNAEIRTTHMTGIVTDIGIELGKMVYLNSQRESERYHRVRADWPRLALLVSLLAAFSAGGLAGALGFKYVGYSSTLPLAGLLVLLAIVPVMDDVRTRTRVLLRRRRGEGFPPSRTGNP